MVNSAGVRRESSGRSKKAWSVSLCARAEKQLTCRCVESFSEKEEKRKCNVHWTTQLAMSLICRWTDELTHHGWKTTRAPCTTGQPYPCPFQNFASPVDASLHTVGLYYEKTFRKENTLKKEIGYTQKLARASPQFRCSAGAHLWVSGGNERKRTETKEERR